MKGPRPTRRPVVRRPVVKSPKYVRDPKREKQPSLRMRTQQPAASLPVTQIGEATLG